MACILIVDDDPGTIRLLLQTLKGLGKMHFTTQAVNALKLAQTVKPDLIILDVEMPELDGIQVCKLIKSDVELQAVPVLFVTSHTDDEMEARALNAGAIDFIRKPPKPLIVRARVANYLALKMRTDHLFVLAQAVEQGTESVVITDQTGHIQYVNHTFEQTTGYARAEVLGLNPQFLKSGLTPQKTYHQLWETLTSGLNWRGEFINRRKSGTLYLAATTITPIQTAEGKITHFVASMIDITEQKNIQDSAHVTLLSTLREAQKRKTESDSLFKAVFENTLIGLAQLEMSGHFLRINQEFANMLGFTTGDLVAQQLTLAQCIHPDDGAAILTCIAQFRGGQRENFSSEVKLAGVGGQARWVNLLIKLYGDPAADSGYLIVAVTDINAQVQARQQIEQSNLQLSLLAANLEKVREDERIRLSRELHDELGQVLTALRMRLLRLGDSGLFGDSELMGEWSALNVMVTAALDATRSIANALRPAVLDTLDLAAAIKSQSQTLGKHLGIRCVCEVPETPVLLSQEVTTHVYRVFQEATTNIARHAQATRVDVRLEIRPDWLHLSIVDNGIGLQAGPPRVTSLGLTGMMERARYLGGTLLIDNPASCHGTRLQMKVPLP